MYNTLTVCHKLIRVHFVILLMRICKPFRKREALLTAKFVAAHTAITAAETGHLIIATLHTKGAVNSIDRIIDSFPASQQSQIRTMLSMVLKTVVSQQIVPDKNGGVVPVFEVMHVNSAIRSMIRENKNHQIANAIASGSKEGMISMDQALIELYREGIITRETALEYADTPDTIKRQLM